MVVLDPEIDASQDVVPAVARLPDVHHLMYEHGGVVGGRGAVVPAPSVRRHVREIAGRERIVFASRLAIVPADDLLIVIYRIVENRKEQSFLPVCQGTRNWACRRRGWRRRWRRGSRRPQRLEPSEHRPARFKKAQTLPRKIFRLERNDGRVKFVARDARNDPRPQASARAAAGGRNPVQQVDNRCLVVGPVLAMPTTGLGVSSNACAKRHRFNLHLRRHRFGARDCSDRAADKVRRPACPAWREQPCKIGELAIVGGATHLQPPPALWLWSMLQSLQKSLQIG